ncbi:MAG: hypothetical protein RMJ47_06470 [Bacteroidota bacterium]|nr:hypothetical protein [Bacteroidota bacterium]
MCVLTEIEYCFRAISHDEPVDPDESHTGQLQAGSRSGSGSYNLGRCHRLSVVTAILTDDEIANRNPIGFVYAVG